MEPQLIFGAITDPAGVGQDAVIFQINPETLDKAEAMGALVYHLQTHLAKALVHFGKAETEFQALAGIMDGASAAMNEALATAQMQGGQ